VGVNAQGADVMKLSGSLADRDRWTVADLCPMERALDLIGTHSAMVLLREVLWGGRRFDELARRAGVTEQIAAKRLRQLVDAGLLAKQPYQQPGQRTRYEYVLTDRGRELFPVLLSLIEFGRLLQGETPLQGETANSLEFVHDRCGAPLVPRIRCTAGHDVALEEATARIAKR
jgi:DNA-binding HxlR family transcriptional regulator